MYYCGDVHPDHCRPAPLIDPEDPTLFLRPEDVPSFVSETISALAKDHCDEFMNIVRDKVGHPPNPGDVVTRPLLLKWAIDHRALRCAQSLLYQTYFRLTDHSSCGLLPLHRAATELLPKFVKLFLERGAYLHSPCDNPHSEYYLMIPIEAALEKLRKMIFWSPTQSVYRLIFALGGTMEMVEACCTISHLMSASRVEGILENINYYAGGGKVIQLAALLYVDGISKCGILKGLSNDEYLELRETVATNILSCSKEDNSFAVDGYGVALSLGKKQVMISILLLLEIFYQTDFSMLGFDTSQEVLAKRMENAGFDCAADGLQDMGNVNASEVVKHHKKMDDQQSPVFFSANSMRMQITELRSTSASHFHEKRGMSSAAQTFEPSKSVVYSRVLGKPNAGPGDPGYVHDYSYHHVIQENDFEDLLKDEDVKSYVKKIFSALRKDNCAKFVKVVQDEMRKASFASFEIAPSLLTWTIFFRAPRCAEAILSGETGQSVYLNVPPNIYEPLPIQVAATKFLPEFVNLFIKYGARLDIPSDHILPLDACLEKLRKKILWTPAHSVYKLIFDLFGNTELEQAYLTISDIMRGMPVEQIRQAICHYILHQKMVELAILLYVNAISNLEVFKNLSLEYLALRQFAAANILSRSEELLYFLVDGNGLTVSNDKKRVMKSMMLLFEIFRRTDFSMLGFDSGHSDLQKRIQDAGFDLINLQDLDDVLATGVGKYPEVSKYSVSVRPLERTAHIARGGVGTTDHNAATGLGKYPEVVSKYPVAVRPLELTAHLARGAVGTTTKRVEISHRRSVFASNFRGLSSTAPAFPASQSFNSKLMLMACTPMDAQATVMKATHEQSLLFGSSLRLCSVLASSIRRTMRV